MLQSSISIDGPDLDILRALGKKLELIIRDAPGVFLTKSELAGGATNLEFTFNESNLASRFNFWRFLY